MDFSLDGLLESPVIWTWGQFTALTQQSFTVDIHCVTKWLSGGTRLFNCFSPEQAGEINIAIELVEDGEVSGYLFDGVTVGDLLEVRGPIGNYFVWRYEMASTLLLLVGSGSGVVPLMAMIRHRASIVATNPTRLLYSVHFWEEVMPAPAPAAVV